MCGGVVMVSLRSALLEGRVLMCGGVVVLLCSVMLEGRCMHASLI